MSEGPFTDLMRSIIDKNNDIIEQAVKKALLGGTCGVKVTRPALGKGIFVTAEVDPSVPYGELHEHQL